MIETRSASIGLNKHKALQQFFRWLVAEGEIERSPMSRVPQPKAMQKLVEVISDEETRRILEACQGSGFAESRHGQREGRVDRTGRRRRCDRRWRPCRGAAVITVERLVLADIEIDHPVAIEHLRDRWKPESPLYRAGQAMFVHLLQWGVEPAEVYLYNRKVQAGETSYFPASRCATST